MTGAHPERIDKYEITDLLGEGAMGVVYRAMDSVLQRFVAVKLMTTGIARDPDLRARFLREARAAGSLQHPNIVTIYDFGEVGDQLFIAMQYIEGADLTEIIQRQDPLPLHAKIDIMIDVLNGLAYAHRRGVIHRDIKPANIRISSEGRAHIMDFGIARLSESSMTKSGVLIGTPDYMSPEQVTGDELTPASDIFAAGTVLYELLTNTKPFKAETLHSVMYKIVSENPRALSDVIPGLPPALQNIVSKALAKKPERRYSGAEPMIEELTNFRLALSGGSGATIAVRRTPLRTLPVEDGPQPVITRHTSARFLAAAGVGAAVLIAALVWRGTRDRPPASAATPPSTLAGTTSAPHDSAAIASPGTAASAPGPGTATRTPTTSPVIAAEAQRAKRVRIDSMDAARAAAARATAARTATAPAQPPPSAATPAPSLPVPVVTAPVAQPAVPDPGPRDPKPELEGLIAAFGKALESMNIAELRRAYPGMTPAQQSGWEQFFGSVKGLRADLTVAQLEINAATAELRVTGAYTYEGRSGKQDRQPVSFVATARREGSEWRLAAMR